MALLRQCLMELRAAQELAQSRETRGARGGPAAAFDRTPLSADALPVAAQRLAAAARQATAGRRPSIHSH